jgi:hypothetical protein
MTELPRKEESGNGLDSFAKIRSSADFVRALTQAALASLEPHLPRFSPEEYSYAVVIWRAAHLENVG